MILPIGDRDFDARRLPWVTFAVICVCALVSLVSASAPQEQAPNPDALLEQAAAFWSTHAYLVPEPEILIRVGQGLTHQQRLERLAELRRESYARWTADDDARRAKQDELDALTAGAFAAREAGPVRSPGLLPIAPSLTGFVTHAFVHERGLGLAANLLVLLLLGAAIEAAWREPLTAAFVLTSVLFSGGFYWAMVPGSTIALTGASALLSSLLGACLVRYGATGCRFQYFAWAGRPLVGSFAVPALAFGGLWGANEIFRAWLAGGLAALPYQADVGGLVFGASCALAVRHFALEDRLQADNASVLTAVEPLSVVDQARRARERRDDAGAFALLQAEARKKSVDRDTILEFWDVAVACRRTDAACRVMLNLIQECVDRGELSAAARYWMQVTELMPGVRLDAETLARLAPALVTLRQVEAAAAALRKAVDPRSEGMKGETAARVVALAKELGDEKTVLAAARIASQSHDLEAVQRVKMRELVESMDGPPGERAERATAAPEEVISHAALNESESPTATETQPEDERETAEAELAAEVVEEPEFEDVVEAAVEADEAVADEQAEPAGEFLDATEVAEETEEAEESVEAEPTLGDAKAEPAERKAGRAAPAPEDAAAALPASEESEASASSEVLARFSGVKVIEGSPEVLGDESLTVRLSDDKSIEVEYSKVQALAAAGVLGLGDGPVVIVDLITNWNAVDEEVLHVVRLRGDRFDPRQLVGDGVRLAEAYRVFLKELHSQAEPIPLPDAESARGRPMRVFESLETYERRVLDVER